MNRTLDLWRKMQMSVPRERGDEPNLIFPYQVLASVFPASVGMNRPGERFYRGVVCVPRERGDEPSPNRFK